MKKPADPTDHDSAFSIYVSSDDGKYYRILERDLQQFEIKGRDKVTKKDLKVLDTLRNHGVAFAGVESADPCLFFYAACRRNYFVNLSHVVPLPSGAKKPK